MEGLVGLITHLRPLLCDLLHPSGIGDVEAREGHSGSIRGLHLDGLAVGIGHTIGLRVSDSMPDATIELVREELGEVRLRLIAIGEAHPCPEVLS